MRVLEIGCGIGLLTQRLRPPLTNVWGIDPSISSLGQAMYVPEIRANSDEVRINVK